MVSLKSILGVAAASGLVVGGVLGVTSYTSADDKAGTATASAEATEETQLKGVSAADLKQLSGGSQEQPAAGKREWAQKIAHYLGVDEATVKQAAGDRRPAQVAMAAIIAKKSGQPLDTVLQAKGDASWKEVAEKYGVDRKEIRGELGKLLTPRAKAGHFMKRHPAYTVKALSTYLGMDAKEVVKLAKEEKVGLMGLVKASVLAKAGEKSLQEVLKVKTPDKSWADTAKSLGVEEKEAKAEANKLFQTFRAEGKEIRGWLKEHREQRKQKRGEENAPAPQSSENGSMKQLMEEMDPFSGEEAPATL